MGRTSSTRLLRMLAGLGAVGAVLLSPAVASAVELPPDTAVDSNGPPLPAGVSADSWLVADATTGQVLAARAGSARRAPASTLKILTALALGPRAPAQVTVAPQDTTVEGSTAALRPNVSYRSTDLVDAMIVASANDAALALARSTGGVDAAIPQLERTARDLGAVDTTAAGVTGLDADGQLTTAYDLAVLARAALGQPELRRAAGLRQLTITGSDGKPRTLSSTNPLLGSYPGAIGLKTGSTSAAGSTFVGAAERGGHLMLVVLLQDQTGYQRQAAALLDWGFRATGVVTPVAALPAPGAAGGAPSASPAAAPPGSHHDRFSPLLGFALFVTLIASAWTYWHGRERRVRSTDGTGPGAAADTSQQDPQVPRATSRSTLAP